MGLSVFRFTRLQVAKQCWGLTRSGRSVNNCYVPESHKQRVEREAGIFDEYDQRRPTYIQFSEELNQDFRFGSSDGTSLHPHPAKRNHFSTISPPERGGG